MLPDLESIARTLRDDPQAATVERLLPELLASAHREEAAADALPLVERAIEVLEPRAVEEGRTEAVGKLRKAAARLRYEFADPVKAEQHLERQLAVYRAARERDAAPGGADRWSRRLVEVATEYLRGGETETALEVLGEAAELDASLNRALDAGRGTASAALNRRLEALSTEEQFDLLHRWTLPGDSPRPVRVWSSLAPVEAPPSEFARALGERPRSNPFPLAEINGVGGLFSLEWRFVKAAEQSGGLRRLISELEALVERDDPKAAYVLLLARIAGSAATRDEPLLTELTERFESGRFGANAAQRAPNAPEDVFSRELTWGVIAAACLEREWLQPFAQDVLERMATATRLDSEQRLDALFRRATAVAVAKRHPGGRADPTGDPQLRLWVPTVAAHSEATETGTPPGVWAEHERHLLVLPGGEHDYLCFRYPLAGSFTFQADVQTGGTERAQGAVIFGGLAYGTSAANESIRIRSIPPRRVVERPFPFFRREAWPTYQRVALKVSDGETTLRINGHPVWTDESAVGVSPWLGLGTVGSRATVFRDLQLTGDFVVPPEVRLAEGSELRGWCFSADPEMFARPPVPQAEPGLLGAMLDAFQVVMDPDRASPAADAERPWSLNEGVIHGARARGVTPPMPSRLSYFRPLQDGESIDYEFFYEPGQYVVHPALGRLAFLFDPEGVRLHWIANGEDDWTGLSARDTVIEPLARRGPRPLPLTPGDWNQVTMTVADDTVTLSLNGTTVYVRAVESDNPRSFGFFHDRSRSASQVRNVVMRGDWPERLDEGLLADLAARRGADAAPSERRAMGELFAERHVADSALAVHRAASRMPVESRYAFLAEWVLPGPDHETLRLALDFTPTHPAPPAVDDDPWDERRLELAEQAGAARVPIGGNLVSPALDLIDAAQRAGRLDEVRQRVADASNAGAYEQRARLAMLALIDIAREDPQPAVDALFELFRLTKTATHTAFPQRWPETLALHGALRHPETQLVGRELAYHLFLGQARNGADSGSEAWRRHIIALAGLARLLDADSGGIGMEAFTAAPKLAQWSNVSQGNARTRGLGYPREHWQLADDGPTNVASHNHDYLYFQSPLRGDFEVQCEVPAFGWRDTQLAVAGQWVGLIYSLDTYERGDMRVTHGRAPVEPPVRKVGKWLSYRVVVRDGQSTTYVNGRELHKQPLADDHFPWMAVRAPRQDGAARKVRIAGHPEIPAELRLSASANLEGWVPYHDSHGVGGPQSGWLQSGDLEAGGGIIGRHRPELGGVYQESLLRYDRPMLEDGAIEYDFYYREGASLCHPALDRMAFLLEPSGVRIHWITDGAFNRTDLPADNASPAEDGGSAAEPLPLKEDDWNHVSVTVEGDTVSLALNGQPILQREIEPTNQRRFGLFHYADQTEARVRRVRWRGDWPRELPPLEEQELAGDEAGFLDARLPELAAAFDHDFAEAGLPEERFSIIHGEVPHNFQTRPDGLYVERQGTAGYRNATIAPRLEIEGDFDITATYDQLDTRASTPGTVSAILLAQFDDPASHECMLYRRQTVGDTGLEQQYFQTALVFREDEQTRRLYSGSEPFEATAGRLRLARRGDRIHFLVAEGDSPLFRMVRTEEVPTSNLALDGVRLLVQTKEPGTIGLVWKSLSIRAEGFSGSAVEDERRLVAELDRRREALPARTVHDFTRDRFTDARFHHWALTPSPRPQPSGQRVIGQPKDEWASAGATPHLRVRGDFDVAFEFDIVRIDRPKPGQQSAVYLQIEFPGDQPLQCNVIAKRSDTGGKMVAAQLRLRNADGSFEYPSIRQQQVETVQRMRFVRHGTQLYFLYAEDASGPDRLLARYEVPETDLPDSHIRLMVHTGGAGRITETAWKKFRIHAGDLSQAR